ETDTTRGRTGSCPDGRGGRKPGGTTPTACRRARPGPGPCPTRPGERLPAVACGTGSEVGGDGPGAVSPNRPVAGAAGVGTGEGVDQDDQRHVLILTGLTPAVPARTVLRLAKEWHLPALAAERVSWTKVLDQRISSTEVPQRVWPVPL